MSKQLAEDFYRLALMSAKKRDLSRSVCIARHALCLAPEDERIQRLLTICRYELEDLDGMDIGLIDELATAKKWRKALAAARTIKHQSVRMCNIRGCLFAAAGRYDKAARWFAKALTKDSGNITARIYLIEALSRKTRLWIRI